MKPKEDPTTLIQQLSDIEAMYVNSTNVVLTEEEKVVTFMSKVPMEYKALLTAKFAEGNATVNNLELIMRAYWRATHGNALTKSKDKEGDKIEKEISLSAFSGTCHKCKKKGHKASNCPTKKSDGNNKVTCSHCGKSGHKIENCWEQNENADKRPKNWKTKQSPETAATTVSGGSMIKVLLGHVSKTMAISLSFSTLLDLTFGLLIWVLQPTVQLTISDYVRSVRMILVESLWAMVKISSQSMSDPSKEWYVISKERKSITSYYKMYVYCQMASSIYSAHRNYRRKGGLCMVTIRWFD
jgi:hypothetical protein